MKLKDVVFTNVGGLKTACVTSEDLVKLIVSEIEYRKSQSDLKPFTIFDSNGQAISLANIDVEFKKALDAADLVHADGQSVVFMSSWVRGVKIPERTPTTDLIHDIPKLTNIRLSHFLLGGEKEIVEAAASKLSKQHECFNIAGTHHGFFDKNEPEQVIEQINAAKPDILWVGLGKPLEQTWVNKYKSALKVPVIISCGGCFNYIVGNYSRAPEWMQKSGLEWLYRTIKEPRKFFWRYLTTNPHSIYCVLKHKFAKRAPQT